MQVLANRGVQVVVRASPKHKEIRSNGIFSRDTIIYFGSAGLFHGALDQNQVFCLFPFPESTGVYIAQLQKGHCVPRIELKHLNFARCHGLLTDRFMILRLQLLELIGPMLLYAADLAVKAGRIREIIVSECFEA